MAEDEIPLVAESDVSPDPESKPAVYDGGPEIIAMSFFVALFLTSMFMFAYVLFTFVTDFILAALFAYLAKPLYDRILPKVWSRTWLASTIVCIVIVIIVAIPTAFLVGSLSVEAVTAYDTTRESVTGAKIEELLFGDSKLAHYTRRIADTVGFEYTPGSVRTAIGQAAGAVATFVGTKVNALIANVFSGLFHFVMIILIVFYLLIDGPKLKRYLFRLSPLPTNEEELITEQFGSVGRAILFGNGIGSLIQGVVGGLTMAAFGMPSAILWATVMTIFAFLPLVGIAIVVVPATIYLAIDGRIGAAIAFFLINMVQAMFVENVVKTRLIGSHMKMHNLLIFLSLIGGLAVFDIIGILYGPLVVTFFLTCARLYETHYEKLIGDRLSRT